MRTGVGLNLELLRPSEQHAEYIRKIKYTISGKPLDTPSISKSKSLAKWLSDPLKFYISATSVIKIKSN